MNCSRVWEKKNQKKVIYAQCIIISTSSISNYARILCVPLYAYIAVKIRNQFEPEFTSQN